MKINEYFYRKINKIITNTFETAKVKSESIKLYYQQKISTLLQDSY